MKVVLNPPVEALLVDLDGTLLTNRMFPLQIDFVVKMVSALSHQTGVRKAASILLAVKRQLETPSNNETNDLRALHVLSQQLNMTLEQSRTLGKETLATVFPTLKRHFTPAPGAKEFLDWAKNHYPLYLATNPVWPLEITELRVKWAGVDPSIFKAITYANNSRACKPDKIFYEDILKQNGLEAEKCLLIGDELKMDLPATVCGIRVFIVGKYSEIKALQFKGANAPAWRGTYKMLRSILETQ